MAALPCDKCGGYTGAHGSWDTPVTILCENCGPNNKTKTKGLILNKIEDMCSNFLYYDRKEDQELGIDRLNEAVNNGDITIKEMVDKFEESLRNTFN